MREVPDEVARRALAHRVRHAQPRGREVLRPPIHAARHHDLRRELLRARARLPRLQEREEGSGEPVGPEGVCAQRVVKLFRCDGPVALEVVGGGDLLCRRVEGRVWRGLCRWPRKTTFKNTTRR